MSVEQQPDPGPWSAAAVGPPGRPAVEVATALRQALAVTVRGKDHLLSMVVTGVLAAGHLLIEDSPGTGKTLLARTLASAIGGRFGRIQCTPDLLPADLTGTNVFRPDRGDWEFHPGPIFANVVVVDEVNRASPRTQAALLEPMEEHQVTVDGVTHRLPSPFVCIATQNPFGQVGTFPLPESQLDRFALVLTVGLPGREAEREIVTGAGGVDRLGVVGPVTDPAELGAAIAAVAAVPCDASVVDYALDLTDAVREDPRVTAGPSPRAAAAVVHLARARAVVAGRNYVTPDDVQAVVCSAYAHRVEVEHRVDTATGWHLVAEVGGRVPVPR